LFQQPSQPYTTETDTQTMTNRSTKIFNCLLTLI